MSKRILPALILLLLSFCIKPTALNDDDVRRYIQAYENIALASPELERMRVEHECITVLTCPPCYPILDRAVVKAGYTDWKSFLASDIRFHLAMKQYAYLELSTLLGRELESEALQKEACSAEDLSAEQRSLCRRIAAYGQYVSRISGFLKYALRVTNTEGDVETVSRHIDALDQALANPDLVADFRHSMQYDD